MKPSTFFVIACVLVPCFVCISLYVFDVMGTPNDTPALGYIPYALALAVLVFVFYRIGKSPQAQTVFIALVLLAVVLVAGYGFLYGQDSMVVTPAQLTGDVATDLAYAEINDAAATVNIKNVGAGLMLIGGILVSALVGSFVAIWIKTKG